MQATNERLRSRAWTTVQIILVLGAFIGGLLGVIGAGSLWFSFHPPPTALLTPDFDSHVHGLETLEGWPTLLGGICAMLWAAAIPIAKYRKRPARFSIITIGLVVAELGVALSLESLRAPYRRIPDTWVTLHIGFLLSLAGALSVGICAAVWLALNLIRKRRLAKA